MFFCRFCGKGFDDKWGCRQHEEAKHGHFHMYDCRFCTRGFSFKDGLRQHVRDKHELYCHLCERRFYDIEGRMQHDKAKHEKKNPDSNAENGEYKLVFEHREQKDLSNFSMALNTSCDTPSLMSFLTISLTPFSSMTSSSCTSVSSPLPDKPRFKVITSEQTDPSTFNSSFLQPASSHLLNSSSLGMPSSLTSSSDCTISSTLLPTSSSLHPSAQSTHFQIVSQVSPLFAHLESPIPLAPPFCIQSVNQVSSQAPRVNIPMSSTTVIGPSVTSNTQSSNMNPQVAILIRQLYEFVRPTSISTAQYLLLLKKWKVKEPPCLFNWSTSYEPQREKTGLRGGLRPGATQIGLRSHRSRRARCLKF